MIEPPGPYHIFKANSTLLEGGSGRMSRIVDAEGTAPQATACACFCYRKANYQADGLANTWANSSSNTCANNSSNTCANNSSNNSSYACFNSACTQNNNSTDTQANHKIRASDTASHDTSGEASTSNNASA